MEVVNSVEQETKVQRKKRCDIIKKKNDALRFVNGNLTNIKKKKKRGANSNEENLIKRKRLVENFLVNDIHVVKENLNVSRIYWDSFSDEKSLRGI